MKFYCKAFKNLQITIGGLHHQFDGHTFETEDADIIAELKANPFVSDTEEVVLEAPKNVEETPATPQGQLLYWKLADRMTVDDIKRYADERNLPYPEDVVKADLLEAVNKAQADKL